MEKKKTVWGMPYCITFFQLTNVWTTKNKGDSWSRSTLSPKQPPKFLSYNRKRFYEEEKVVHLVLVNKLRPNPCCHIWCTPIHHDVLLGPIGLPLQITNKSHRNLEKINRRGIRDLHTWNNHISWDLSEDRKMGLPQIHPSIDQTCVLKEEQKELLKEKWVITIFLFCVSWFLYARESSKLSQQTKKSNHLLTKLLFSKTLLCFFCFSVL